MAGAELLGGRDGKQRCTKQLYPDAATLSGCSGRLGEAGVQVFLKMLPSADPQALWSSTLLR